MMRIAFTLVLLAGAIFYSYIAFSDLSFMTRTGRLGPGFFPRVIGVAAIIMMIWALIDELRKQIPSYNDENHHFGDVALLIALALGYAVLLRFFGGFVATIIFLAITLFFLNPGQHLKNLAVSVLVPVAVYLLFDKLLNANMPPALFALPL
ncbi:MAG: tripartite tricarboxylate transporter TctB family protein [Granulosicoccus sp.]